MTNAKLYFLGEERELLWTSMSYDKFTCGKGSPRSDMEGGMITLVFTTQENDDVFMHNMTKEVELETDRMEDGEIHFWDKGINEAVTRKYKFKDTYIVGFSEIFSTYHTGNMQTHLTISPAIQDYGAKLVKHWNKSWIPPSEPAPYQPQKEEEKEKVEIDDIYLDKSDATVLYNYGKVTGDIRIIDRYDWEDANAIGDDTEKVNKLKSDSRVVLVNDIQIQEKIQEIHALTNKVEEQIFIVLNRDTANVEAVFGPEGVDGLTEIDAEYKGIGKDDNGKTIYSKSPTIKADGKRYPLLGQVHTHNLMKSEPTNPNQVFGSTDTKENGFGTSSIDQATAMSLGIEIYSLDSWNFYSKTAEVIINRVDPTGKETKGIGKSIGKGQGKKIVNVGLECLNLKVGRK
ncbi:type VI secretion system tube protein TssD [Flavobacterium aestivum]|uniref:type VI secretion system tube protein TssD n=1 Tax=Flavobacterium aestivum TaxID=3003257 RepID=UPI002285401C|nr:type VI secretion system tube protein TssD [Flavobacterium aestivum]